MHFFAFLSFAIVAIFSLPSANAAPNKDAVACDNPVPSIRIAGCTRLLAQKNIPSKFLWQIYLQRSQGHANQGEFDRALADLDIAIQKNPRSAVAYSDRGNARNGLGQYDLGIQDTEKAIQLDPTYALAYATRGYSFLQKSNFDKAITDFDKAIRLAPSLQAPYTNRANAWRAKGELDLALADIDAAIRMDRNRSLPYANRCSILDAKEQFDAAIADCDRALSLDPQSIVARNNRGNSRFRKGDLDGALADFDQLVQIDPRNAGAYTGRAEVRRAKGDAARALADLDQAIRLHPTVAAGFANRGLLHEAAGDIEKARSDYETAVALPATIGVQSSHGNYLQNSARDQGIARTRLALLKESAVTPSNAPAAEPRAAILQPAAYQGRRVALVIGNGAYLGAPALANPANDARVIAKNLRDIGFEVSEGNDLKHADMKRTIHDFLRGAASSRMAMVFYAGHGMQIDGRNYLVPVDADFSRGINLAADMTDVDFILTGLDDRIRTNIIVLDACRDNPLAQKSAQVAESGRSVTVRSGLAAPGGLGAGATLGAGTLLAFATAPGQVALDGDGANSPFSAALGRHISTPGLEVQQMLTRVRSEVVSATVNKQVPWSNSSLLGEVYLVGGKS